MPCPFSLRVPCVGCAGGAVTSLPVLSLSAAWPRYRIIGTADSGQYNLEITDAELSDDASYECQATEAALRSRRAKLTVLSKGPPAPLALLLQGSPSPPAPLPVSGLCPALD